LQNRRHAVVEFVIDSATVTVRIPNQSDLINAWDVGKDRWLWRINQSVNNKVRIGLK
jgi:hypothetical protein